MDYQYENLGPERFQMFCQSLLIAQFPKLQCLPIGQPDGGRDALAYYDANQTENFIVFQVKFVRKPTEHQDPHRWLVEIMRDEAPKLAKLIPKGAKEYYLLTNIRGTAHPEIGSIDKAQSILNSSLSIPAMCWWRDDLNSRLHAMADLKWAFPELMTGTDMLRHIVEEGLTEDRSRRTTTIQVFLRDQYERDTEVRFKQVELQNKLLDLFIDVPIGPPANVRDDKRNRREHIDILRHISLGFQIQSSPTQTKLEYLQRYYYESVAELGAATALLNPTLQEKIPQLVLEGAPGQGKSTIVQYVCQVHRMQILGEGDLLRNLPEEHQATGARIPFRVDLRDFATWIGGVDPFSNDNKEAPTNWNKSLDSFLAAQVRHHAGGAEFTVSDLHAVSRLSPLLVVLDGLDEVADIATRTEVIALISSGLKHLREVSPSVQAIITSRPPAFANSPGFPEDKFPHVELRSLTPELIFQYAEKWLQARRLEARESKEIKKILKEKLKEPHLRELARNPMQLAILLSLIHTRGASLPDKRTALYDSYIELFFNRESEKSLIVREHRDLLVDIHRYLAWYLHSASELGNRRGSISGDDLRNLLYDYLRSEERDTTIVDSLFAGMVERVVALVSRVEGTFEFEVQPLREYFAARYLYETAPNSPIGKESRGSKPDRFDALSRNFYWLNVTRFYAGCYSKGELPSLVDSLSALVEEKGYKFTNHPRILAMILLSDWVFSQHARSMKQAVNLVLDGIGLRYALNGSRVIRGHETPLILPKGNGNDELIARCFEILELLPPRDYAEHVIALLNANSTSEERSDRWLQTASLAKGGARTKWLEYGLMMSLLPKLTTTQVDQLVEDGEDKQARYSLLFKARKFDYFTKSDEITREIIDFILDGNIEVYPFRRVTSFIEQFSFAIDPRLYAIAFQARLHLPLKNREMRDLFQFVSIDAEENIEIDPAEMIESPKLSIFQNCIEVINVANQQTNRTGEEWTTRLDPWDKIVETSRGLFGERWAHFQLACIAAGVKSHDETYTSYSDFFDDNLSLCRRARYARLRAGNPKWWEGQFVSTKDLYSNMFLVLMLGTWGSGNTIRVLSTAMQEVVEELPNERWNQLYKSLQRSFNLIGNSSKKLSLEDLGRNPSPRLVTALSNRINSEAFESLFHEIFKEYDGDDPAILEQCQRRAYDALRSGTDNWLDCLKVISRSYQKGIEFDEYELYSIVRQTDLWDLSEEAAKIIIEEPQNYPHAITVLAESKWRRIIADEIKPVGQVAQEENWFHL